jgi:hypothetical protein
MTSTRAEVVRQPFFHIIANHIADALGPERSAEIIATTLVAFALSSILTGLSSFLKVKYEQSTYEAS